MARKGFEARTKRKVRIRKKVFGTSDRPRLTVYRSLRHIYAQLIDDAGRTLVAVSSLSEDVLEAKKGVKGKTAVGKIVGVALAKKAQEKNIKKVVFDRSGYLYHGRVKAVADGAREGGLSF